MLTGDYMIRRRRLELDAADDGGPVAVGDGLVPAGARRTGGVMGREVEALVVAVAVFGVGEPPVSARTRDWNRKIQLRTRDWSTNVRLRTRAPV